MENVVVFVYENDCWNIKFPEKEAHPESMVDNYHKHGHPAFQTTVNHLVDLFLLDVAKK